MHVCLSSCVCLSIIYHFGSKNASALKDLEQFCRAEVCHSLSKYLFNYLSVCLSIIYYVGYKNASALRDLEQFCRAEVCCWLSMYLSIYIYLSIYLSFYLSVCLAASVYLSISYHVGSKNASALRELEQFCRAEVRCYLSIYLFNC